MAQILITNYTGTVTSDIVVCEAVGSAPNYAIGTCYNLATIYGTAGQISPVTPLPAYYQIPSSFDYLQNCFIQLSASTTLFTVPQLITCGDEPPGTWGFESCGLALDKNIYVFYDTSGSYPDGGVQTAFGDSGQTLSGASIAIRNWYYDLVQNSGYTGQLFEIPVANERYVNWPCYPHLGSTTGGTLSDNVTQVRIEMGSITHSLGNNASIVTSAVVRRIALGYDITTGNPLPNLPGYSKGVPFNHSNYTEQGCQLGTLATKDDNYISIIVLNEACNQNTNTGSGCGYAISTSGGTNFVQPYFEFRAGSNTSFISINNISPVLSPNNPQPLLKVPDFCPAFGGYSSGSYSGSSIQRDYESWIKVWEDVNVTLDGFAKVFFFPVPTNKVLAEIGGNIGAVNQAQGFGTLYQTIELVEGEVPQAPSYFNSEYCEGLFSSTGTQWPNPNQRMNNLSGVTNGQYYDFTPLSYFNKFSVFSATTAYQSLPAQYQLGPGLKNFGWKIDATITSFTENLVANDLGAYLQNILSGSKIYSLTEPTNIEEDNVYTLQDFEGCWTFTGYRLDGQPAYPELNTLQEFGSCFECENDPTPLEVFFKFNGFNAIYSSNGYISTAVTADNSIEIVGNPNDTLDIEMSWPFPIGTDIPGAKFSIYDTNANTWSPLFTLGVTTGFTTTLDSSGFNTLEYSFTQGSYGFEFIKFNITASTLGASVGVTLNSTSLYTNPPAQLPPVNYTCISFIKLPAPGISTYMMVAGVSSVSAATSATSCSNYSVEKSYLINPAPQGGTLDYILNNWQSIPFRFSDAQTQATVNGGNNWIAISNCQFTVYGQTMNTIAVQIDATGYIINAGQC